MKITLDDSVLPCLRCKNEDLTYYREPKINYANQEGETFFIYYLLCNSCKLHFAYVRKETVLRHRIHTKSGIIEDKPKLCVAGFYDLENQPNYDL